MQTVNLGIVAHVDAGKTSLTERLLHATGAIDRLGSVDAGTTRTDTGEIERRRGITIRSAVAPFRVRDRQVNLLDTPGHSDFVAEVERALGVLDAAVLVVSAVEGVQPHTRRLMRILRSLRLPTLIFVNKIDRVGARTDELVADVRRLLTPAVAPLGTVRAPGTPGAAVRPQDPGYADRLAEVLAEHDDELLATLVDDLPPDPGRIDEALRAQTAAGLVHPLLFGSAMSGAGVPELLDAVAALLPPSPPAEPAPRARVFAVERDAAGERVVYLRSYGGRLRARQRVVAYRREPDGRTTATRARITGLDVAGATADHAGPGTLTAGHIARVTGLTGVRLGDQLGSPAGLDGRSHFPAPTVEAVIRPVTRPGRRRCTPRCWTSRTPTRSCGPGWPRRAARACSSTARCSARCWRRRWPRRTGSRRTSDRAASCTWSGRPAPAGRWRSSGTASSARSASGSSRAPGSTTAWRWNSARCRCRSTRPSRRPPGPPWTRAGTVGR
ncbi:GTP-binding protein [Micromonospora maritima]|uniref:GTP-binding protein n=1 Tax=Micromonospora maritima TaxID=986711 RepID=UPI0033745855